MATVPTMVIGLGSTATPLRGGAIEMTHGDQCEGRALAQHVRNPTQE